MRYSTTTYDIEQNQPGTGWTVVFTSSTREEAIAAIAEFREGGVWPGEYRLVRQVVTRLTQVEY